jgi:osmotically-inducible protein OsmY
MLKYFTVILLLFLTGCVNDAVVPSVAGSWFNHDRRTANAIIDDQSITVKANLAIAKNKAIWNHSHISTLSYNGTLLLVGQTKSEANKTAIKSIVEAIPGVTTIYNQITVGPSISLKTRANDTWITTQVKARLVSNRDIGINRVKVITENGIVYLMGSLTEDEEQTTLNITRRVPGVQKVVSVIERQPDVIK